VEREDLSQIMSEFRRVIVPEIRREIDQSIDARVSPRFERVETALDAVAAETHTLRSEVTAMSAALKRVEDRVERLEFRMASVGAKIEELAETSPTSKRRSRRSSSASPPSNPATDVHDECAEVGSGMTKEELNEVLRRFQGEVFLPEFRQLSMKRSHFRRRRRTDSRSGA
jgi:chromosome segregation ATPase